MPEATPTATPAPVPSLAHRALRRVGRELWSLAIALVVWFGLRSLVFATFHIDSGSMEKTLLVGDVLVINRTLYGAEVPLVHTKLPSFRLPARGEVVVFESVETPGLDVIKRVIGAPGDTLSIQEGRLYRNGVAVDEPYVQLGATEPPVYAEVQAKMAAWQSPYLVGGPRASYQPTHWNWGPLVVPPDHLFMMGDNRDVSWDSRYWGFLPVNRVKGRAELVYYSYDEGSWRVLPVLTAPRLGRAFTVIR